MSKNDLGLAAIGDNAIELITSNRLPHYEAYGWHHWPEHAEHFQHDNPTIGQEVLCDWLADVFKIDQARLLATSHNPLI